MTTFSIRADDHRSEILAMLLLADEKKNKKETK
jgi:hypothetical protein